ncbi:MAG: hypothetical protein ACRDTG_18030 [Pseudonocardiaceae bacterium]
MLDEEQHHTTATPRDSAAVTPPGTRDRTSIEQPYRLSQFLFGLSVRKLLNQVHYKNETIS